MKLTDEVMAHHPILHTTQMDLTDPLTQQMIHAQYYLAMDAGGIHP
jgi:hypothetical protein